MNATPQERRDWLFPVLVIGAGIVLRLIWLTQAEQGPFAFSGAGEATRVALELARTGTFGGAFYAGYGPTAHLSPIAPFIAGAIMTTLGIDTPASNGTLLAWSLFQMVAGWGLLSVLFRQLGAPAQARRWGLAALCLIPVFVRQETVDFRYWEGALTLVLVLGNLILLNTVQGQARPGLRRVALIAGLTALTFFLCPPAGAAINLCWAIWAIRTLDLRRLAGFALACCAALAMLVAPWAMRNAAVMGEPVLLRSNAGLELAMGNHPAALSDRAPEQVFADRLLAIHPYQSVGARADLARAGGEVAYARILGRQTRDWIAANPADFATLSLRHFRQFFFPDAWQMYFTGWEGMRSARATAMGIASAIGLVGLAAGLWQRRRGYAPIALYLIGVALPYAMVQPIQRYSYLVHGILMMLAADAVVRLLRWISRRVRDGRDRPAAALPAAP